MCYTKSNDTDKNDDVAVKIVKNGAVKCIKGKGAELAADCFKFMAKTADKKIKNEVLRNATVKELKKLSNANAVNQMASTVIEIGSTIKSYVNGEISKADLLRKVGEKSAGRIVATVYGTVGMTFGAFAGPIGMAVGQTLGSMIGYMANKMLFQSVLQAFEDEEESRRRYEFIHEFCEQAIAQMEAQRLEFKQNAARFFAHRQQVIDDSFHQIDAAMDNDDFDRLSEALNKIAVEFGHELQFKDMDEFDSFMSDNNAVFEL